MVSIECANLLDLQTTTSRRVLVVDDECCIQEVVQGCLEELAGWEVLTASSGLEGLRKVVEGKPDAVIVDFMMPGMDGLEFLYLLRQIPGGQAIPVVLMTAKMALTQPDMLLSLGVAGAIAKPFDLDLLPTQLAIAFGWSNDNGF